jgi:glycosyltransferase involved in cell wall biosynthesis
MPDSFVPRVLLVGGTLTGGGSERRFSNLVQHLFGGNLTACVLKGVSPSEPELGSVISLGWAGARSYLRMAAHLRRLIRRGRFDVAVSFGRYPNLLLWAASRSLRRTLRPKIVLTEITRPWTEYRSHGRRLDAVIQKLMAYTYPRCDLLAANSEDGLRECVEHYRVEERRARRIPNVIDGAFVEARGREETPFARPGYEHVVCTLGRLVPLKRTATLLEAIAMLPDSIPCAALMIGGGPEEASLRTLAERLGVADRCLFPGWSDNPYPLVRRCDALVMCSEYEGFSNAVLEAMFLDVPVITSFWGRDAVEMCAAGAALGFEVGDKEALRNHLLTLFSDASAREALLHGAREYRRRHSLAVAVKAYEELIQDVSSAGRQEMPECGGRDRGHSHARET